MDINNQRVNTKTSNNDMTIGGINRKQVQEPKDNAVLNQEDFLKIIAANISNPPIPGSGGEGGGNQTDFVGQMVQMNLLEQVTDLTTSIQSTMLMTHQQQALSLVGKHVMIAGEDSERIKGLVEKIRFTPNGTATVQVNGKEYSLQNVTQVSDQPILDDPKEDEVEDNDESNKVE